MPADADVEDVGVDLDGVDVSSSVGECHGDICTRSGTHDQQAFEAAIREPSVDLFIESLVPSVTCRAKDLMRDTVDAHDKAGFDLLLRDSVVGRPGGCRSLLQDRQRDRRDDETTAQDGPPGDPISSRE
jgi:hypothetical protein